jgi:hypothetical protein
MPPQGFGPLLNIFDLLGGYHGRSGVSKIAQTYENLNCLRAGLLLILLLFYV